jgi:hypothetical protein
VLNDLQFLVNASLGLYLQLLLERSSLAAVALRAFRPRRTSGLARGLRGSAMLTT